MIRTQACLTPMPGGRDREGSLCRRGPLSSAKVIQLIQQMLIGLDCALGERYTWGPCSPETHDPGR